MTKYQGQGAGGEAPHYPNPRPRGRSAQDDKRGLSSVGCSLLFLSFAYRWSRMAARRLRLNDADRAVRLGECLVRNPPDVGLGDPVHAVEIAEQLAPIGQKADRNP